MQIGVPVPFEINTTQTPEKKYQKDYLSGKERQHK